MRMVLPLYTFAPPAWPCRGLAFPGFWGWTLATSVHYTAGKKRAKNPSNSLVNFLKPQFLHSHTLPRSHLIHRQLIACCWLHLSGERLTLSRTFSAKWHRYPISS